MTTTADGQDPREQRDYHLPVLLTETLDALAIRPDGIYADLTFGGGGHSRGILQRLGPKGRLFAFDQDSDARRNLPAVSNSAIVAPFRKYLLNCRTSGSKSFNWLILAKMGSQLFMG